MLIATEAIPQKNRLTLFARVTFYFFDWVLGSLRAGVARGAPVRRHSIVHGAKMLFRVVLRVK